MTSGLPKSAKNTLLAGVTTGIIVIFHFASIAPASAAGDCSLEIVRQASFNEFLSFALLNCEAGDPITNLTMNGSHPLEPVTCLTQFNSKNSGQYPIPDKGACRDDFLQLLQFISRIPLADAGFKYDNTTGVVSFNYEGFDSTIAGFEEFMDRTGHPVIINACEPNYVRRQSVAGFYRSAMVGILGDGTRDYNIYSVEAAGFIGGQYQTLADGLCVGCYQTFLDFVQAGTLDTHSNQFSFSNFPSNILAKCVYDPEGPDCVSSPQVHRLRSDFTQCAGSNLQVDFVGPLCTPQVSSKIQEMRLFSTAVFCTINHYPFVPGCEDWQTQLALLHNQLLSDCVVCVTDLIQDVQSILNSTRNVTLKTACSSLDSIGEPACITELGIALSIFSDCAGIPIADLKVSYDFNSPSPMEDGNMRQSSSSSVIFANTSLLIVGFFLSMF